MVERKTKFALLSFFAKAYYGKTGQTPVINKYAAQWDADAILQSYGNETEELIVRYLALTSNPSWKGFCRNADKVYKGMIEEQEDERSRKLLKQRAKEWADE